MAGANAQESIIIDLPKEKFFEVITDYMSYPEIVPEVMSMKILEEDGNTSIVENNVNMIKKVSYVLKLTKTPYTKLEWTLVKGFFKKNEGRWDLEDVDGGKKCKATYTVTVEIGMLVPKKIVRDLTQMGLPKMLKQFKDYAEAKYK